MAYANTNARNHRRHRVKRHRTKRQSSSIYVGIVGFILVSVYLLGYLYRFMSKETIAIETVQAGNIEQSVIYNGIIIRDEHTVNSNAEGTVTYYYSEGDKVQKNATICSIKDLTQTQNIQEQIDLKDEKISAVQNSRSEISFIQDDINRTNKKIKTIADSYTVGTLEERLNNLYTFKNRIDDEINFRNRLLLSDNQGSARAMIEERNKFNEQLDAATNNLTAPVSGIFSFSFDEFEPTYSIENMESLTEEQIDMNIKQSERIDTANVKIDQPVFKIIDSFQWYIAAYIENDLCDEWAIGDLKKLNINDLDKTSIDVKIKNIVAKPGIDKSLVIFYTDKNINEYLDKRSIEFKIETKVYEGLKVPNTALVEKTFLKIPNDCIMQIDYQDKVQDCVIKLQDTSQIPTPIEISSKDETESSVYIQQNLASESGIKIGDRLMKNNSEIYTINNDVISKSGVYVVNNGIANLKLVEIVATTSEYSIVEPIGNYKTLQAHDKIVSDSKNIEEGKLVY